MAKQVTKQSRPLAAAAAPSKRVPLTEPGRKSSSDPENDTEQDIELIRKERNELDSSLQNLEIQFKNLQVQDTSKRILLLRNHHFSLQIKEKLADELSNSSRIKTSILPHDQQKIQHTGTAINFADYFDTVLFGPSRPLSISYMQTLREMLDIRLTDDTELGQVKVFYDEHMLWLQREVGAILNKGAPEALSLLLEVLRRVVTAVRLGGLGRVGLFMLVSYLARRIESIRESGLWWDLYETVMGGGYGKVSEK
jgi:hypothetical protein